MSQKPLSTTAAERMNLVAQDEIWKCRLKAETEARQNWPAKWGYLTTSMKEVFPKVWFTHVYKGPDMTESEGLLEGEEEPHTPKPKIELPSHFRVRPVSPMDKYIKILPSPPVPKSTQGFIGWRSGVPALYGLERYTEIQSCKGAYAQELCWPKQGVH